MYPMMDTTLSARIPSYVESYAPTYASSSDEEPEVKKSQKIKYVTSSKKYEEKKYGWYKYIDTEYAEYIKYVDLSKTHYLIGRDELYLHILNMKDEINRLKMMKSESTSYAEKKGFNNRKKKATECYKKYIKDFDRKYGHFKKFHKMRNSEVNQERKDEFDKDFFIRNLMSELF